MGPGSSRKPPARFSRAQTVVGGQLQVPHWRERGWLRGEAPGLHSSVFSTSPLELRPFRSLWGPRCMVGLRFISWRTCSPFLHLQQRLFSAFKNDLILIVFFSRLLLASHPPLWAVPVAAPPPAESVKKKKKKKSSQAEEGSAPCTQVIKQMLLF